MLYNGENNVCNIFQSILMNCNSFQQLIKDTVRNNASSTLKEEICRSDSSVKDIKFHRKIAVLIPDIRSHQQHSLSKIYFRKHDEYRHFLVDVFSRMLETKFMVLPVFQSALLSRRLGNYYSMKELKK